MTLYITYVKKGSQSEINLYLSLIQKLVRNFFELDMESFKFDSQELNLLDLENYVKQAREIEVEINKHSKKKINFFYGEKLQIKIQESKQ